MKKRLSLLLFLVGSITIPGIFLKPATAQVTPDGTTNTTVNTEGNNLTIQNGDRAGNNLFHSFQDFSVPDGGSAFFDHPTDIANILSRVTGGNISNIDGLIRANGSANLFLINPAGIIFGEGARLDLGGSFYGSSASSILFEDGEFSAVDLENPPLLTINAPIGLGFRDNPGEITVRGDGNGTRTNDDLIDTENALRVNSSSTLGLIGGNLNLEGATLKTDGGRIELGSVAGNEQISFTPIDRGLSLGYEGVENFGDLNLSQTATVDASGSVAGEIQLQGNNLTLTNGSRIEASTLGNIPTQETPGIIEINVSDTINIDDAEINSSVKPLRQGNAGDIIIDATNVSLTNGASLNSSTAGAGNGGNIEIDADRVKLENALVNATAFATGSGGTVRINAAESVEISGFGFSRLQEIILAPALQNPNALDNFNIDDINTSLFQGILAATTGQGEAGGIEINTPHLSILDGSLIGAASTGEGLAGAIAINTPELLEINQAVVTTSSIDVADAGSIEINTGQLSISNGGTVVASTLSSGDGGDIEINATKLVELKGVFDLNNPSSLVVGSQRVETSGDAGNLQISTPQLTVRDGAVITANTLGQGDGGNIEIDASNTINVLNNGIIAVSGQGQGNAGELNIQADSLTLENGSSLAALTSAGDGGSITLQIDDDLTLRDNSTISAQALQDANGGNLDIDARFIVAFPSNGNDNDIIASAEQGDGGDITINAESLFGIAEGVAIEGNNINDIDASSEFGLSGNVSINTPDVNAIQADIELPDNIVESQETIAQACKRDRSSAPVSSLTIFSFDNALGWKYIPYASFDGFDI